MHLLTISLHNFAPSTLIPPRGSPKRRIDFPASHPQNRKTSVPRCRSNTSGNAVEQLIFRNYAPSELRIPVFVGPEPGRSSTFLPWPRASFSPSPAMRGAIRFFPCFHYAPHPIPDCTALGSHCAVLIRALVESQPFGACPDRSRSGPFHHLNLPALSSRPKRGHPSEVARASVSCRPFSHGDFSAKSQRASQRNDPAASVRL
jgi:hypothetical protein